MNNQERLIKDFFSNPQFNERDGVCLIIEQMLINPQLTSKHIADEILNEIPEINEDHDDKLDNVCSTLYGYCSKTCSLYRFEERIHPVITDEAQVVIDYYGYNRGKNE